MSELKGLEQAFLDTLAALRSELRHLVIVGGWCPYLYAHYLWKKPIPNLPTTLDVDLGVAETGPRKFGTTVYDRLRQLGLATERLHDQEPEPIEFIHRRELLEMKLEFITSFETSDDTLNRFLGRKLACHRIDAFEILLKDPLTLQVGAPGKLAVQVPRPELFLFHKGITFVNRSEPMKRDKDLFYVYFILRFSPDAPGLLDAVARLKSHEYFGAFRRNLRGYLADPSHEGYRMLRPFVSRWVAERDVNREIEETFQGLLRRLDHK
ncbi:MAG: hypothetical protein HYZ95_03720 [Candidatus Omnitrophica bacterium]|nr:hypothetical protein [Candidatus Omnitrophota bacterium]